MKIKSLILVCLICIVFSNQIFSQGCTEENFIDLPLGPLPTTGSIVTEYGMPIITDVTCTALGDPNSVQLVCDDNGSGTVGDGFRYTTNFGINPTPTFEAGKTYEFGFLKFISSDASFQSVMVRVKASNVPINSYDHCPSGDCEVIKSAEVTTSFGICDESWYSMFTTYSPTQDYDNMVFSVLAETANGEVIVVNFDKICVQEVMDECNADFTYDVDRCGVLCTNNNSTPNINYNWTLTGPNGYSATNNSFNFCEQLPEPGSYTLTLVIFDTNGCEEVIEQTFDVDFDQTPPEIECWEDVVLNLDFGPDCSINYNFPTIDAMDESAFTMECFVDGVPVSAGQSILLTEGPHTVKCVAIDVCENVSDTCEFEILVQCEAMEDCIEDFESYTPTPLMNTAGNWQTLNADVSFFQDPTSANGTMTLRGKDQSFQSFMSNLVDFSGDWTTYGCELCFDIRYDAGSTVNPPTGIYAIYLFQNNSSNLNNINPVTSGNWARFRVNTPIGNQWTRVCVPTTIASGGILPSNGFGSWVNPTPTDWDNLVQNVSGVGFNLDFASGPFQSENLYVDNFCFETCPPQDEPCGYTCCEENPNLDIENIPLGPLSNSTPSGWYSEYGGPAVANIGCNGSRNSIALSGASFAFSGDAAGYRINGVIGSEDIFLEDKLYCISFCARFDPGPGTTAADLTLKATDSSPQSGTPCNGGCEIISIINNPTDGVWADYQVFFTPSTNFSNIVFANGSTGPVDGPPTIYIDEVCVSEAIPVTNDNIPPVIRCPQNTLVIGNDGINGCIATYTMPIIVATDNIGVDSIYCTANGTQINSGQVINVPSTSPVKIECIAVDLCGNADTCGYEVTAFCEPVGSCNSTCESSFSINLSTGIDALGNKIPSGVGVTDPEWRLINSPVTSNCSSPLTADGNAYVTNWVHPSTSGWVNLPGVSVISPFDQGNNLGYGCNNPFNKEGSRIPFVFERTFCLCEAAGVDLNLNFRGDDQLYLELWDVTANTLVGRSNTFTYVSTTESWIQSFVLPSSTYALRAYLTNTNSTTLGAAIQGGITLQNMSEPLILDSGECCINENIAVRKILDLDCSESFTSGDQLGVGWTFNLMQGGSIIATAQTDINGEIIFSGLTPGSYTVSEVQQSGFQLASPASNNATVTVTAGGFHTIEFYNCPSPPVECDSLMVMISDPTCIDSSVITGLPCITVIDPVCGCDGKTYNNACEAQEAGISVTSPGECNGNNTPTLAEGCCYNVDLKNNWGYDISQVEVNMLTPGWIFNNVNLSFPFTFGPCSTLNNQFCVQTPSGSIPSGTNRSMQFCLAANDPTAPNVQMVEFAWKQMVNEEEYVVCRDTMIFECDNSPKPDTCLSISELETNCDPDNPYRYDVCFKVENKSTFPINYITLEDLDPSAFRFLPGQTINKVVFPLPNPLPPNTISNTICIKVQTPLPILSPDSLYINVGAVNTTEDTCCHDAVRLCVPIEPCCNPCEDRDLSYRKLDSGEGECCYAVDIANACEYDYFSKLEFDIKTSGVCYGGHTMNPAFTSQFTISTTANSICVTPNSGYLPKGNYSDFLQFCLDKIDDPSKDLPIIEVKWYTSDPITGESSIACMDSIITDCESPDENVCLMVSDQEVECIADSNKYRYTFTLTNKSNPRFVADKLHLFVKNDPTNWIPVPTGNIIPLSMPIDSGQSVTVTTCIMGPGFPAPFSDFVFSYRLQGVNSNDCCFESICDTIPVPPCDSIPCEMEKECISITDQGLQDFNCDTFSCFDDPFCNDWLVNLINGASVNCGSFDSLNYYTAYYNGLPVIVFETYNSLFGGPYEKYIYSCDQDVLEYCLQDQSCFDSLDNLVTLKTPIWKCGDPPVTLSSNCGGMNVLDYCITVKNESSTPLDSIRLDINQTGASIGINTIHFSHALPSDSSRQVCFSVSTQDTSDIKLTIEPLGRDTCCLAETLCIDVPLCPVDSTCCDISEEEFCDLFDTVTTPVSVSSCEACWDFSPLDSCDILSVSIDQGPFIEQPQLGYCADNLSPGVHTFCFTMERLDNNGEACINKDTCYEIFVECPPAECCDITTEDYKTYILSNLSLVTSDCDVCLNLDLDTCDNVLMKWESGGTLFAPDLNGLNCNTYPQPGGTYNITFGAWRNDPANPGLLCVRFDTVFTVMVECPPSNCCDIEEEEFCTYFDDLVTPISQAPCELCYDFSDVEECDLLGISIDGAPFDNPILDTLCYDNLSEGVHNICFEITRTNENNTVCIEKDTCYEIFIECPQTNCCDITEEEFCNYFDDLTSYTQEGCEIKWNFELDSCDALQVILPDGTSTTPNIGDSLVIDISNPGVDSICFFIERWNPDNMFAPCFIKDTCIYFDQDCPSCPSCPAGTITGSNLITNGDFENGQTGFTSDYVISTLSTDIGEYDVKSGSVFSTTDPEWCQNDHTFSTISGKMLVANGPLPNAAVWKQTVPVVPGNSYVFCAWVNNLICPEDANSGPPLVEVIINGSNIIVPATQVDVLPDQWVLITGTWVAPSGTTSASLEIFNRQAVEDADLAIDDISFVECSSTPSTCCTDKMRFDSLVNIGWQVMIDDCNVTVSAPQFDTCHWFGTDGPDWGDGSVTSPVITPAVPVQTYTHSYANSGTYNICITVFEGNDIDESCWNDQMCTTVTVDCCNEEPCDLTSIVASPNSTSNDSCCYEVTIDNQYCQPNYFKGFRITMSGGSTISSITGLNGYIINRINNNLAEVYHPNGFVPQGQQSAFSLCGNGASGINFSVSWLVPDGQGGYNSICPEDFTRDCSFNDPRCVFILEDSIQCETNEYCIRIKNNTYPGFTINSVDLIGITPSGASIQPNPISIPSIAPGDTSGWICLNYTGVNAGDSICFFVVGHDTDITMNEPPTWCCADTVQHCFVVPQCGDEGDCCDISQDSFELQFPFLAINSDESTCEYCVDFSLDSCNFMDVDLGDGIIQTFGPGGSHSTCRQFTPPGTTTEVMTWTMYRLDNQGDTCRQYTTEFDIDFECGPEDCCDDVTEQDLDEYFESFIDDILVIDSCGICIEWDIDNCLGALILDYGDGTIDTLYESDYYCHDYNAPGPWSLNVKIEFYQNDGTICITGDSTYIIDLPNCPSTMGDPCCDNITTNDLLDLIDDAYANITTVDCQVCIPVEADSCDHIEVSWGDGSNESFIGSDTVCHDYASDGQYNITMRVYRLDASGNICVDTSLINSVNMDECNTSSICNPADIIIYNAVSPNNDNLNETLELVVPDQCGQVDVSIYNRWGQLVWSQADYQNTWSGQSHLNELLPDGTYYLILALPDARDEDAKPFKALNTFIDLRRDNR